MALPAPQPQASRRALVALDVDGTLIGWDGTMSPAVRAAVADVVAAGHHVVLATGRSVVSVQGVARRLGIEDGNGETCTLQPRRRAHADDAGADDSDGARHVFMPSAGAGSTPPRE